MRIKVLHHHPPLFALTGQGDEHGDRRRYYVARKSTGRRMIIVCRNNLELEDLVNTTVDAGIGWEQGTVGFVHDENTDQRHTKVTIYRTTDKSPQRTLWQVVTAAPETDDD